MVIEDEDLAADTGLVKKGDEGGRDVLPSDSGSTDTRAKRGTGQSGGLYRLLDSFTVNGRGDVASAAVRSGAEDYCVDARGRARCLQRRVTFGRADHRPRR